MPGRTARRAGPVILTIATALLPILFVVGLGYVAARADIIPSCGAGILSKFVVDFALPLSLFLAAAKASPSDLSNWRYGLALLAGLLGTFVVAAVVGCFVFGNGQRVSAVQGLACCFPNLAYCGPPVLGAVVGPTGILAVVIGNLILSVIVLPLSLVLIGGDPGKAGVPQGKGALLMSSLLGAVKQPLVWLPVLGVVFAFSGLHMPDLLASTTNEVGSASGGVALFNLGLMLAALPLRISREAVANVAMKNVMQPALLLGAAFLFGLRGTLLQEVFLIGVLPSATLVPALAHADRAYESQAALTVMASTLFAIISISVGIAIAGKLP